MITDLTNLVKELVEKTQHLEEEASKFKRTVEEILEEVPKYAQSTIELYNEVTKVSKEQKRLLEIVSPKE